LYLAVGLHNGSTAARVALVHDGTFQHKDLCTGCSHVAVATMYWGQTSTDWWLAECVQDCPHLYDYKQVEWTAVLMMMMMKDKSTLAWR